MIQSNDGDGESLVYEESQEKLATAIYPTASLMNHSCKPNIIVRSVKLNEQYYDGFAIYMCVYVNWS